MSSCPSSQTSGAVFAGVPMRSEGHSLLVSCSGCLFESKGLYFDWGRGFGVPSSDIHCGRVDRRVTPVRGCSKHLSGGAIIGPRPLEH